MIFIDYIKKIMSGRPRSFLILFVSCVFSAALAFPLVFLVSNVENRVFRIFAFILALLLIASAFISLVCYFIWQLKANRRDGA